MTGLDSPAPWLVPGPPLATLSYSEVLLTALTTFPEPTCCWPSTSVIRCEPTLRGKVDEPAMRMAVSFDGWGCGGSCRLVAKH